MSLDLAWGIADTLNGLMALPNPVSYTHLAVYKRQAEGRVVFKAVKDGFKHVGLRPGNFIAYKAAVLHLLQL